ARRRRQRRRTCSSCAPSFGEPAGGGGAGVSSRRPRHRVLGQPRQLSVPSVQEPLPEAVSVINPTAGLPSSVAPPTVPSWVPEIRFPTSPTGASISTMPFWPGTKLPLTVLFDVYW